LDNDGMYIQVGGTANAYFLKDNMLVNNAVFRDIGLGNYHIQVDPKDDGFSIAYIDGGQ
jgi:hypothetical protein